MRSFANISFGAVLICFSLLAAGCGGGASSDAAAVTPPSAGGNQAAVTKPLNAPTGVDATGGITKVTLNWDPVAGADSYNIYWSTNPGVTPATGTRIAGATSPYQHVGLYVSRTYFYVVTAVSSPGESGASSQASTVAATDSAGLYDTNCAGCHGPVTSTTIVEGTSDKITAAIANNTGGMGTLTSLTANQIDVISQQLPCH